MNILSELTLSQSMITHFYGEIFFNSIVVKKTGLELTNPVFLISSPD